MGEKKRDNRVIQGIFAILALLLFICIVVQVFLAGIALFVDFGQWNYHTTFIHFFEFAPIVMLILAFFGGIPKALRWQSFGLYLLIIMQYITIQLSGSVSFLTALHPVIALLLFWRSLVTAQTALKLIRKAEASV